MKSNIRNTHFIDGCIKFLIIFLLMHTYNQNEISLTIDKSKGSSIISSSYYSYVSEVVVNGKSGNIDNYISLLNDKINNVIIKFNQNLNRCSSMFYPLGNILYIDFSHFSSSNLNNMAYMFAYCDSLQSVNLDNIDTSLVTSSIICFMDVFH